MDCTDTKDPQSKANWESWQNESPVEKSADAIVRYGAMIDLKKSAEGLVMKLSPQGSEGLTDWEVVKMLREMCASIRSTFPEEETEAAGGLSSNEIDKAWQEMRTIAHDVLLSLGSARRRMVILDGDVKLGQFSCQEDDQLSDLNLSFFPAVDGFQDQGSCNSPTESSWPGVNLLGSGTPEESLTFGSSPRLTLVDVVSKCSSEELIETARGIKATLPDCSSLNETASASWRNVSTTMSQETMDNLQKLSEYLRLASFAQESLF